MTTDAVDELPDATPAEAPLPENLPGAVGTAHPIFVQSVAPDGHWVAFCQAREDTDGDGEVRVHTGMHGELFGDAVSLYFATAEEPRGIPIDAVAGADPTGRWVALIRDGELHLLDTRTGDDTNLSASGAAAQDDDNPTMSHRATSFAEDGSRVAYLRGEGGSEEVVVRDLASGDESTVDVGEGRVWRAELLGDGRWLFAGVVTSDADGNGTLDLPVQSTSLARGQCRGRPLSYSTGGYRGDPWERRFVRVPDGHRITEDVVAWQGAVIVTKHEDGSLHVATAAGDDREVVPASCDGTVHWLHLESNALLVACAAEGDPAPLAVFRGGARHDLDITTARSERARWGTGRVAIVGSAHVIDLEEARVHPRAYRGEEAVDGTRLLETMRGGQLRLRDLSTGRTERIAELGDGYTWGRRWDRWVAVASRARTIVVDLEEEVVVGRLPNMPVAIRPDGAALVHSSEDPRDPRGPLAWQRPR